MHCNHSFDVSQHSVAQIATSLTRKADRWGMQISPGQRFFVEEKNKGIYSKILIFRNDIFRLIGEEAKIKAAQKDQKGLHHSRQSLLIKGSSSLSRPQHLSPLSRCYQQMLTVWPTPSSDNQQRRRPIQVWYQVTSFVQVEETLSGVVGDQRAVISGFSFILFIYLFI